MDIVGKVNRLVLWVGYLAWGPLWGCSKSCLQLKALKVKFLFWCLMLGKVADAAAPFLCAPASFFGKGDVASISKPIDNVSKGDMRQLGH